MRKLLLSRGAPQSDHVMQLLDQFAEIIKPDEPLAPYTHLKVGGPAQTFARPRSAEQLVQLVRRCATEQLPVRILGGGANLLVRDEGVRGVVVRLSEPAFTGVEVKGNVVKASAGAALSALISESAKRALAGLEPLVGIPGTVGGALRANAGTRSGDIGQRVRRVEVMDSQGRLHVRDRDDIQFSPQGSTLDDAVILAAEFELEPDDPDAILKRMRKFWIHKKAHQPFSFQACGLIFKDPRGLAADQLIEQAGLKGMRVGGAEISERHANYIVAELGATARDVLRLIDLVRTRVADQFAQTLQLNVVVW
jgi:UDP-N-acetylmuramate dehydrogenase